MSRKNTSPLGKGDFFLASSPCTFVRLPFARAFSPHPRHEVQIISLCVRSAGSDAFSSSVVSTMVLSETRGLLLCWVVRGSIRCPVRLVWRLPLTWILTLEPERSVTDGPQSHSSRVPRTPRAQAACNFRCSASNVSPFFQMHKVIAAILRARVSRAIAGAIPLPSNPS